MDQIIFEYFNRFVDKIGRDFLIWLDNHGLEIVTILVVAWVVRRYGGSFLSRIFHSTIRADLYPTKTDRLQRLETIDSITNAVLRVGVFIVAGIMIISELGVNTAPLIASAGVLGIALGFGAQSLIKDFTSGMFIIIDNQYRVGDVIRLNDISGKVEAITLRTTVLRGLDGTLYHIPHGTIDTTANMTMSYGGIDENITFDQSIDINRLIMIINRIGTDMASDPKFTKKITVPPHFDRVIGIDINGVKVKVIGTTTTNDSWEIRGEFYRRLLVELNKAKLALPSMKIMLQEPARSPKKPSTKSKS